jgi:hypothetical protein
VANVQKVLSCPAMFLVKGVRAARKREHAEGFVVKNM